MEDEKKVETKVETKETKAETPAAEETGEVKKEVKSEEMVPVDGETEPTATKEPTETENGCQERKCEICGFTDTCELPLPATGGEIGGGEVPSGTTTE